ncbi:MAG: hypothetical protein AABZ36_00785 [Nitrospirota bacterium]
MSKRSSRKIKLLVVFLLLAVFSMIPSHASAAPAAFFGINAENRYGNDDLATLEQRFIMMEAAGAKSVRTYFLWYKVQPDGNITNPAQWNWSYIDNVVQKAKAHNLEVVAILAGSPKWAISSSYWGSIGSDGLPNYYDYTPLNRQKFVDFAKAAANRYKPGGTLFPDGSWGVKAYEIWGEVNVRPLDYGIGWGGADLYYYAEMLRQSYSAIHGTCSNCIVLNGAIGDDVIPYYPICAYCRDVPIYGVRQFVWQGVNDLYWAIERGNTIDNNPDHYFDVLNVHTYEWKALSKYGPYPDVYPDQIGQLRYEFPDRRWYQHRISKIIESMNYYGDPGKKIWMTETGYVGIDGCIEPGSGDQWFTGCLTPANQANSLSLVFTQYNALVERVFWWQDYDIWYSGGLGIIRADLSPKPAYAKFAQLTGPVISSHSSPYWASYADYLASTLSIAYKTTNLTDSTIKNIKVLSASVTSGVTLSTQTPLTLFPSTIPTSASSSTFTLKYKDPQGGSSFSHIITFEYQDAGGNIRRSNATVSNPPALPTP